MLFVICSFVLCYVIFSTCKLVSYFPRKESSCKDKRITCLKKLFTFFATFVVTSSVLSVLLRNNTLLVVKLSLFIVIAVVAVQLLESIIMQYKYKHLKNVCKRIITLAVCITALCYIGTPKYFYSCFLQVAHITLDSKQYKVVAVDKTGDIAYYVPVSSNIVVKGDTLTVVKTNKKYEVAYTDTKGFYLKTKVPLEAGLSGTPVVDKDGNQVGYVSEQCGSNVLYCISTQE